MTIVNLWVSRFESQMNFRCARDPKARRVLFRNIVPHPGEQDTYVTQAPNAMTGNSFGVVSLLANREPGSHSSTRLLIIRRDQYREQ